jgi:hypothetical protein
MADEQLSDPFDSLIRDVASSGPTDATPNNQTDAGAGTPPQATDSANPSAQDESTANLGQQSPDQELKPSEENPTAPKQLDGKGLLPDHLKPFEAILKNKQWDLSKPEGIVKALQSYQEAETTLGRRTTEANLLLSRSQEIERDFLAGPEGINRRLEAMGFSKLDIPTPENRMKELQGIYSNLQTALHPNATEEQRNAAIENLNKLVYEPMDTLRIRQAAGVGQAQTAQAKMRDYRTNSATLFNQITAANPELHQAFDAILPAFQPGGVFHSLGLDEFSMTSSPERAKALSEIGQAVAFKQSSYNPDGSVKDGGPVDVEIKKALALAGRATNAAPVGNGQPPVNNSNGNNQDPFDKMLNDWALESATV